MSGNFAFIFVATISVRLLCADFNTAKATLSEYLLGCPTFSVAAVEGPV